MKQIIPFTKDITFKTKIGELVSISLDNDLTLKGEDLITGNFYLKGKYKMLKTSELEEEYSYKIPCDIAISDDYETYDATVDVDDFNYEIINEEILRIKITLIIDNLTKKEEKVDNIRLEISNEKELNPQVEDNRCFDEESDEIEDIEELKELEEFASMNYEHNLIENNNNMTIIKEETLDVDNKININDNTSILSIVNEEETYATYSVYMVRENDSIETILEKYKISLLELSDYNDTSNIKEGMKLIIPNINND